MNILVIGTSSFFSKKLVCTLELQLKCNIYLKKHTEEYIFDKNLNYYSLNKLNIDIAIYLSTLKKGLNSEIYESNIIYPLKLIEKLSRNTIIINLDSTSYEYRNNSYSYSKKIFKNLLEMNHCKSVNLRIEHIYGYYPAENITSFFIKKMLKNENIELSSGNQVRNFIYIDDAISAILKCIEYIDMLNYNSTIDIASNDKISIKELVILIKELTKSQSILYFDRIDIDKNEFKNIDFNNRILKNFGWTQKMNLIDGLKNEINEVKNEIFKK